jgi:SAM-dependent methyltransferase
VLDLACGDAHMAEPLLALGLRYRGVDGSEGMIAEARRLHGEALPLEVAPMETYEPPECVDATLILNAIVYPEDRVAFLRHVAGYTRKKVVFDFNPRQLDAAEIERDLRLAGLQLAARRGYLVPQSMRLPGPLAAGLRRLEPLDAAASLVLRLRGQWLYAAVPYRV